MVPPPRSTFTVQESTRPDRDIFHPEEIWLSTDPGHTASLMKDCCNDRGFGYYVRVADAKDGPNNKPTSEDMCSARRARDDVTITSSGLEEDSTTNISARSSHLLEELLTIIDAYLADDPKRALLAEDGLVPPKFPKHIEVDEGTTEAPFNWQFERCTLRLTETLLQLGQEACRWKQAERQKKGLLFTAPLPTYPGDKILIISGFRARKTDIAAAPKVIEAASQANADFFITMGSEIIATIESKPHCGPRDTGDLVRTRKDPFRQQAIADLSQTDDLRLLLELGSQPLAADCRSVLLVADWGRLLLPYEVRKSDTESGHAQIVFASTGSYCDVLTGELACNVASSESNIGLAGQTSPSFRLEHLPNTVFFLLGWILQVIERRQELEAEAKTTAAKQRDDDPEDDGPPAKRTRLRTKGDEMSSEESPAVRRSSRVIESGKGANDAADSGPDCLPLITDYVSLAYWKLADNVARPLGRGA